MSTATPPAASLDSIIAQLQETGLVPPDQLAPFIPPAASPTDAQALTNQLVERGLLTKFQASQVATGKAKSLVIGTYSMLDRVTGGGGLLFKAVHRRMQRVVFIKPLPPSLMKTAAPRIQRDVIAAGRFIHPNLVAVQDLDEVGGAYFLVSEFVDGADLATVAQQGKLAIDKACGLVAQAAEGLAYLHAQGIAHRDVKIENLFIERGGAVKLFGLGVSAAETGDAAGDVLGLGRVLYRLVAGADLPPGATPALKAARPEASAALEKFCLRMVSTNPSERPSAAEVAAAMKSPELTAPAPIVDPAASMFPELFVSAEEEASTVMSAPFDPAALPPMNPPTAPAPAPASQPAMAPAPVEMSTPAAFAPAPVPYAPAPFVPAPLTPAPFAPSPYAPAPTAPAPYAPAAMAPVTQNLPVSPNMPPAPMAVDPMAPAAMAPAAMMPAAAPGAPPAVEFTINMAPAPAAESEVAVVSEAEGDEGLAVATLEAAPSEGTFAATTTTASKPAARKKKSTKPIDLPFNLKLDPKYLEPKYVAGAAGGALVLVTLLVWALVGGSNKPAAVKAVPATPVSRGPKPLAPADITPGMFNLPPSTPAAAGRSAAKNQPGVEFDEFGFQKQAPATPAKPKK